MTVTDQAEYLLLARQMDNETATWSAGYSRHEAYNQIGSLGIMALAWLLADIRADRPSEGFWWRHELVCLIAGWTDLPLPQFLPDERGKSTFVRQRLLDWSDENRLEP